MFRAIARLVTGRPWAVIAFGVAFVVVSAVLGMSAFGKLQSQGFDDPDAESTRAADLIEQSFDTTGDFVVMVSTPEGSAGRVDQGPYLAAGQALTARLAADPRLSGVTSWFTVQAPALLSGDGRHAMITAELAQGHDDDGPEVVDDYTSTSPDSDGVVVRVGGTEGTYAAIEGQLGGDLTLAESIAIPLILALLVLVFGNGVGALVTFGVSGVAILGTFAVLSVMGSITDVSVYAINLTTGMGIGLAVDYGLLMVARVREERATGAEHREAVRRAVETAGRTIAFSAMTVAFALASMLVFPLYFLSSFAYAGIGVMVVTAFGAIVLLPAVITLLGDRVDAWRVPGVRGIRGGEAPFWVRLARAVVRRPLLVILPVAALLLIAASPLLGVKFGVPDDRVLPTSNASRQVGDLLREQFTGEGSDPVLVVVDGTPSEADLQAYADAVAAVPGVERVDVSPGDGRTLVSAITDVDSASGEASDLVEAVRALPDPAGATAYVGGAAASLHDSLAAIGKGAPIAFGWMVVTTFVLLFLFTGSVLQPLRALVLNVLGLSATLGVMVWVFQEGHLSGLLGFTPQPINTSMLVLLFCVAFGLSMDYEVFVMGRITEVHAQGVPVREAVVHGLGRTGRIVTTAAALIAIAMFAFMVSGISFMKFFGLGTGLAILIDATLIRGLLLPAVVALMGRAAWWSPRPLRRLHQRFGLSEEAPAAAVE